MGYIPKSVSSDTMESLVQNERKELFNDKKEALDNLIRVDMKHEKNELRLYVLSAILNMSVYNEEDYQAKKFVYNDGHFRSKEEIDVYNLDLKRKEDTERRLKQLEANRQYYNSGQYDQDCKKGKLACWIPVFIDAGLFLISFCDLYTFFDMWLWTMFLSPVAFGITLFLISRQAKYCEELAIKHQVPTSSSSYQNAIHTRQSAKLGAVAAALTTYHTVSKEVKSITNPEHWNVLN
mgnify:CR=1 FL=1